MENRNLEPLLTVQEAASVLRVKPSWLYARIHRGDLPFDYCKVGHYVRIPERSLQEFLGRQLSSEEQCPS